MIDLLKEAEEYFNFEIEPFLLKCSIEDCNIIRNGLVEFATNSKYVQAKILQSKIDFITNEMDDINWDIRKIYVEELQQQLKQLEDETNN